MSGDVGQRLGRRDRFVERRTAQAAGEGEEAGLVGIPARLPPTTTA